jgi:ribosomal peptide maturation radical SAM protein 1
MKIFNSPPFWKRELHHPAPSKRKPASYQIILINMPFAALNMPSFALTQLKSVVKEKFADRVSTELLYLDHHFGKDMGADVYTYISHDPSLKAQIAGFGDWFFRQSVFPQLPDNTPEYFTRFKSHFGKDATDRFTNQLKGFRDRLDPYLDSLIDLYHIQEADLVGFTSMFFQTMAGAAMAGRIKARNPKIVTVMGGANAEAEMGIELVHHLPNIDYVFSGPALVSFPQFVDCLLEGKEKEAEGIDGVFTRRNTQSIVDLPQASMVEKNGCSRVKGIGIIGKELDINTLVELDYDSYLESIEELLPSLRNLCLLFETSRGCWWGQKSHCTFCGLNGMSMKYSSMQVDKALDMLHGLFRRYSQKVDCFFAVDNILSKNYYTDFLNRLEVPSHVSLFYEIKADLKEDDFKALAKARVLRIQPGIESLASSTLRLMGKGVTAFSNLQFLRRVAAYEIEAAWNLLIGFPGESASVFEKYLLDLPLLTHLPPPDGVYPVRFDRFSPYFRQASKYKLDLRPRDSYSMTYPFPKEVIENMAYYFYNNNFAAEFWEDFPRFVKQLETLVAHWQKRWKGQDKLPPAQLHFKAAGSNVVFDSRSGAAVEIALNDQERLILKALEDPLDLELLEKKHPQFGSTEVQKTVLGLSAKKLLFSEGERWMNLVLPEPLRNRQQ